MPVEDSLPLRTNHTNGPSSRSLRSTSVSQKEEHTHETGRAGAQDLKTRAGFPVKQHEHKHLKDTFAEPGRARETEREED